MESREREQSFFFPNLEHFPLSGERARISVFAQAQSVPHKVEGEVKIKAPVGATLRWQCEIQIPGSCGSDTAAAV